jgi:hypothetical protein
MNAAFAFLDLLGFSEYVKSDLVGAARLLESQKITLASRLADARHYERNEAPVLPLARDHLVTSFDYFLPFSDSIVIASATPDLFVRQLATFLISAFTFTGHIYAFPENPARPEEVRMRTFGATTSSSTPENWYPALWRGGLSFGKVELFHSPALVDGKLDEVRMLVGTPVVTAVGLEKNSGKGPRLFCESTFKDHLTDPGLRACFVPVPEKSCDEFLWPIFQFHDPTNPLLALHQVHELLPSAINLWRAKRNTAVAAHYFEFVRLIGRSGMKWSECHGIAKAGHDFLRQQFVTFAGEDLIEMVLS